MTSSHSNETEMLFRSKRFSPFVLVPAILGVLVMVDAGVCKPFATASTKPLAA